MFNQLFKSETTLPYSVRRSARAKRTRIVVSADKIEVVAPPEISERKIKAFVDAQQAWILDALKRVVSRTHTVTGLAPTHYAEGAVIPYQGRHLPLIVKPSSAKSTRLQLLPENQFVVYLPVSMAETESSQHIKVALERWMKHQAKQHALQMIAKHASQFSLHPRSLRIKTQKSRWGSCGPKNDINLNWLLMLAPPVVMEYVVIHELCHIQHKNHSRDFWALVAAHMPDYLQHRRWLKQHGASLMKGL